MNEEKYSKEELNQLKDGVDQLEKTLKDGVEQLKKEMHESFDEMHESFDEMHSSLNGINASLDQMSDYYDGILYLQVAEEARRKYGTKGYKKHVHRMVQEQKDRYARKHQFD